MSQDDAQTVFNEAERTSSEAGDVRSRALLLGSYGSVRGLGDGDLREYARLTRQAIALAEESGDPALYLTLAANAYAFHCIGEYREAVAIYDRAIELADDDPALGGGIIMGCPYAWCHAFKGLLLSELGELEQARRLIEQGRKIAREQGDIETVAYSHMGSAAWLAYFQGEPEAALTHAQQALEIAERNGGALARAVAWLALGLAERMRGEWRPAIEALERSRAIARESRTAIETEAWRLALLGESYLGLGDPGRARPGRRGARSRPRAGERSLRDTCEPGAGAGPARLCRSRGPCADRGGAHTGTRAGARDGREGLRAAGPRRARRAGAPERRSGRARARAPRGASPVHGDRRERPCRAPVGRAGDTCELAAVL
jgi:tetratricopeptide (TPR) repeat protein